MGGMDGRAAEALERRITLLQAAVRMAVCGGDRRGAARLRGELSRASREWESALGLDPLPGDPHPGAWGPGRAGTLLPLRGQVHEALALLEVPAAPRLLAEVHDAFFAAPFSPARLTSLRRDELRSYSLQPGGRPYYICAALGARNLSPVRGLLAISSWPLERRLIGPDSTRADYLAAVIAVAGAITSLPAPSQPALQLLARFAAGIRGASRSPGGLPAGPQDVIQAARAQLDALREDDDRIRGEAARRARDHLDDGQQMFGLPLRASGH